MGRHRHDKRPIIESEKVYCKCDELTATIFDRQELIEATVSQMTGPDQNLLSGGVTLSFYDRDARSNPVGAAIFFMSHSAAARLGRKLIAAANLDGFV